MLPGLDNERSEPPLSYWTPDRIITRRDMEIKNGGFGMVEIRDLYEDVVDYGQESEDEVVDLSKHNETDTYSTEGLTKEVTVLYIFICEF